MKKTIVIVLVLSLVISNFAFASTITLPKETEWYYEAVKYCDENGLLEGVLVGPELKNEPLTRAEFLTIFMKSVGQKPEDQYIDNKYKDVKKDDWFAAAVYWADSNYVTNGVAKDKFDPYGKITREQAATFVMRYLEVNYLVMPKTDKAVTLNDLANVSEYAKDYVSKVIEYGLFKGDEKKNYLPKNNITQPQGITLFARIHRIYVAGEIKTVLPWENNEGGNNPPEVEEPTTPIKPIGSGKTAVPDHIITYDGKDYNVTTYDGYKAFVKTIKYSKVYGKLFEENNRQTTPGGNITWIPPQKLKAEDPITSDLNVDNLAPIEWLVNDDFREIREEIGKALDKARIEAGGGNLVLDEGLMATAQNRAEYHARAGLPLNHDITRSYTGWTPGAPKDRFGNQSGGAEVLGYTNIMNADLMVGVWMASEGHRSTIINNGKEIHKDTCYAGVGVGQIEGHGYFICVVFGAKTTD